MICEAEREALTTACRRLSDSGLVVGTAGNLSVRTGDHVAITATGLHLGRATPQDITVVDLKGDVVDGRYAPTSEVALHLGIYLSGTASAVAHAHPLACTAVSCTSRVLPALHYTIAEFGGPVRVAPYATFGTQALADSVVAALEGRTAALMANHGAVAHGTSIEQACDRLELLEWLARLHTTVFGPAEPHVLTADQIADVVSQAIERRYGTQQRLDADDTFGSPR